MQYLRRKHSAMRQKRHTYNVNIGQSYEDDNAEFNHGKSCLNPKPRTSNRHFSKSLHDDVITRKRIGLCGGNSSVTSEFPSQRTSNTGFDIFRDIKENKQ